MKGACFMVAHHCQSKKKKKKKYYSEKNSTKLPWPISAKSDETFLFKKKKKHKITMAQECQI